jgi:hypothetical protein
MGWKCGLEFAGLSLWAGVEGWNCEPEMWAGVEGMEMWAEVVGLSCGLEMWT